MPAAALLDLVARFRERMPDYKRSQHNEALPQRALPEPLGNDSIFLFLQTRSSCRHDHS